MLATAHARSQLSRFLRDLARAPLRQERLLIRLLARRRDTDFGREHGFASIGSVDQFRAAVPIRDYEGLRPYMDRVVAGDAAALLAADEPIRMFAVSSGTTDRPKRIPVTDAFVRAYRRGWNIFGVKALTDHPSGWLRHILQVSSRMDESRTDAGVPCGAISGLLAKSQKRLVRRFYAVPPQTAYIDDADARYYGIMRLAAPKDVAFCVAASPATQLRIARAAQHHTERLIRDIRDGTLTLPVGMPESAVSTQPGRGARGPIDVLSRIRARLRPDPATARRFERIHAREGQLLPRHFWNLAFLANWTGGTMGLHLADFPACFGDTPVRDIGLLATEGRVSIGLGDGSPAGVLDIESAFFEFIEEGASNDAADTRLCHEVDAGRTYRVIMTNPAGLYRYDLGDYVRVVRFEGLAPVIEFLHRGRHTASMTGEKLTEWQVVRAYAAATEAVDAAADLFVLAPRWADPPYYALYVESDGAAAERLARQVDAALCDLNVEYRAKRATHRLAPVAARPLQPGTLAQRNARRMAQRGGANEQFKHQYLMSRPGEDEDLPAAQDEEPASRIG